MRRTKSARMLGTVIGAVSVAVMVGVVPVRGGIIDPELAIDGGTGIPGGTVTVTLSLADDIADAGISAGIDLVFGEELEFFPPVAESCAVDARIAGTHGVAGRLLQPNVLNLEVFVAGTPNPLPPLGNGPLVSCDFQIKAGVPAGTVALEIASPFLGDDQGQQIPVRIRDGSVRVIDSFPTQTPTATSTPQPTDTPTVTGTPTSTSVVTATATATASVTVTNTPGTTTPTATATVTGTRTTPAATATSTHTPPTQVTATATATRTGGTPTATRKPSGGDSGCNVGPVSREPAAAGLLLLPALLLWARRRSR